MLVSNPARMLAVIVSLISLILPESIKDNVLMKGLRQFTFWNSISLLATNGEKGLWGLAKGTVNSTLGQMKDLADSSKTIDHDAVEALEKFDPVRHFEKTLQLNETENKLVNVVYQNITVGNLLDKTILNEKTRDVTINTNALFTDEEKKVLASWPNFKVEAVYKKMLTAVYDANRDKIRKTIHKPEGKPPLGYSKEYLATLYLKEQYKYPLTGTTCEGNAHSSTSKFTSVFEYELVDSTKDTNKFAAEKEYKEWLTKENAKNLVTG